MIKTSDQQREFSNDSLFLKTHQFILIAILIYVPVFYYLGATVVSFFLLLFTLIISPSIFVLSQRNLPKTARTLLILMCSVDAYGCSLGLSHSVNLQLYTIPFMALAILLFEKNQTKSIVLGLLIATFSGFSISHKSTIQWIKPALLDDRMIQFFSEFNFIGATLMMAVFIYLFVQSNRNQQDLIKGLLRSADNAMKDALSAKQELSQQQIFLQNFLDASPSAIYVKDLQGRYIHCNKAFQDAFGKSREQIIGKTAFEIFPTMEAEAFTKKGELLIKSKSSAVFEFLVPLIHGPRWMLMNVFPLVGEDGAVSALGGLVMDIHESKLQRIHFESLSAALDKSAIVAMTDDKGKITYVNKKFEDVTGYSKAELIGRDHRIINSGRQTKSFFGDLWDVILSGQCWHGVIQNKRKDGSFYWVDTTIAPMRSRSNSIDGFVSIRFEVTEQKEAELKLLNSSKMAILGEMASGIAHEINNPLAIISGKSNYLRRRIENGTFDSEKALADLLKIEDTCLRVTKIISAMRDFSRDGQRDPMEKVRLAKIVKDTITLCEQRLIDSGIEFSSEVDKELELECRQLQIAQVLMNLISNAHDAAQLQDEKWVKLEAKKLGDQIRISVTDSGTGIPDQIVEKIMQPFFSTKEVGKGTGLGLSVSKGIIEDHAGSLWYDNQSSHTRFVIDLPIAHIGFRTGARRAA